MHQYQNKSVTCGFHGPEACHTNFHGRLLCRRDCKIDSAISVSVLCTVRHCNAVIERSAVTTITTAALCSERNPPLLNKGDGVCAKPPPPLAVPQWSTSAHFGLLCHPAEQLCPIQRLQGQHNLIICTRLTSDVAFLSLETQVFTYSRLYCHFYYLLCHMCHMTERQEGQDDFTWHDHFLPWMCLSVKLYTCIHLTGTFFSFKVKNVFFVSLFQRSKGSSVDCRNCCFYLCGIIIYLWRKL